MFHRALRFFSACGKLVKYVKNRKTPFQEAVHIVKNFSVLSSIWERGHCKRLYLDLGGATLENRFFFQRTPLKVLINSVNSSTDYYRVYTRYPISEACQADPIQAFYGFSTGQPLFLHCFQQFPQPVENLRKKARYFSYFFFTVLSAFSAAVSNIRLTASRLKPYTYKFLSSEDNRKGRRL
jgi:hypothetical protein